MSTLPELDRRMRAAGVIARKLEEECAESASALGIERDAINAKLDALEEKHQRAATAAKELADGIESLIGKTDKPTEDEIADPVPGGNGGVFKGAGAGASESDRMDDIKRRFENNQTCTHDEIADAEKWFGAIVWGRAIKANQAGPGHPRDAGHGIPDRGTFALSDMTAGESDYAPDPDPEDKEGKVV